MSKKVGSSLEISKYTKLAVVVVVKWSACSPYTTTIRVQFPLMSTVFSVKFVFEKNENKEKEGGVGPFFKICEAY